ncbi:tyrosine-type recombinase/integrase [Corynebacterium variabile]|uniref:tyrosine-type recombinase/integrase n=1 Tax=Corynebacterium variabile TaxID=1727 RepID=UPI003A90A11A
MTRGRPATALGTYGEINTTQLPTGMWQAETRMRLQSGHRKRVRARGKSRTAAIDALKVKCRDLDATTDTGTLTSTSTLTALLTYWIDRHDVSESSKMTYRRCIDLHITPNLGDVRLNELTTAGLQGFLDRLPHGTAKTARAVIGCAVKEATRLNVMASSPVQNTRLPKVEKREPRALTDAEITAYRTRLVQWCGGNQMGPKRGAGMVEIIDVCIGSGCRIGEVLALRWCDVDLKAGTITIAGTIDKATGTRKDMPKTVKSRRTIPVAGIALDALQRQWDRPVRQFLGEPVFPTRTGTYMTVDNAEKRLRDARDGEDDITPHDFRKTVATKIERDHGMLAASRYLGHSSTAVTEQAYLARPEVMPDYTGSFAVKLLRAV